MRPETSLFRDIEGLTNSIARTDLPVPLKSGSCRSCGVHYENLVALPLPVESRADITALRRR